MGAASAAYCALSAGSQPIEELALARSNTCQLIIIKNGRIKGEGKTQNTEDPRWHKCFSVFLVRPQNICF